MINNDAFGAVHESAIDVVNGAAPASKCHRVIVVRQIT
jgi:hypothetical protein